MNRDIYVSQPPVREFIDWLAPRLNSSELSHQWINRKTRQVRAFSSIYEAYRGYAWPFSIALPSGEQLAGRSFSSRHRALSRVATGLRQSVSEDSDEAAVAWSLLVMRWGSVFPGNGRWLVDHADGLAAELGRCAQLLGAQADDSHLAPIRRFNAGMSKVYSLLLDDFLIYDSRVAATLGWVIVKFCQAAGYPMVPESLKFPMGTAKETAGTEHPKQRNPSQEALQFPGLRSGPAYARANLQASWLLTAVLKHGGSPFDREPAPLAALEAAFFMIGYDLGPVGQQGNTATDDESGWDGAVFRLETRGGARARQFGYHFNGRVLHIRTERNRHDEFPLEELHFIVNRLVAQFGNGWFPLANNVQKLGDGSERPGLGQTILEARPRDITHAQAGSYLGVILEDLGLTTWNGKNRGIEWRLEGKVPTVESLTDRLALTTES